LRGARRRSAEATAFIAAQRLRRRHSRRRLDHIVGSLHCDRCNRTGTAWRTALTEIFAPHRYGAIHALRTGEYARIDAVRRDRPARRRTDERR
jgi:type II secretory ATPase GspE/PulE/Tfp pilus assembly ATPase PilB-like protein